MTLLRRALAVALAACLVAVVPGAATGAPTIVVEPGSLPRGPDPSVPYVSGATIVDGDRTIPLPAAGGGMLGRSGDDYVVWTSAGARTPRIWRVAPDGQATELLRSREAYAAALSANGDRLVVPRTKVKDRRTVLTVRDSTTGAVEAEGTVRGYASVLDFDGGVVVVGSTSPSRTLQWAVDSGDRERISSLTGYAADRSADRLAVFTGDPYDGGCSVVSALSDPATQLSRSCTERVTAFSPDGERLALVDLLTDGIGPNRVIVRTAGGRRVITYEAPYYFGLVTWESPRGLLLLTSSTKRSAMVRCVRADCERVSKLGPSPELRPVPAGSGLRLPARPATRS